MQPELKCDRRKRTIPAATDHRRHEAGEGKVDPFTANPIDDEATAFMKAMERYKRQNRRPFPTWSEVLEVLRALGYRKAGESSAAMEAGDDNPSGDPRTTPATIDRRQKNIPVAHDRRRFGVDAANPSESEPPVPPKG